MTDYASDYARWYESLFRYMWIIGGLRGCFGSFVCHGWVNVSTLGPRREAVEVPTRK